MANVPTRWGVHTEQRWVGERCWVPRPCGALACPENAVRVYLTRCAASQLLKSSSDSTIWEEPLDMP